MLRKLQLLGGGLVCLAVSGSGVVFPLYFIPLARDRFELGIYALLSVALAISGIVLLDWLLKWQLRTRGGK